MSKYRLPTQQLRQAIAKADRILLTLTTGLDGDSLGSLVAMSHALDKLGKRWFAYVPEDVPAMFHYMTKRRAIMREMDSGVHDFPLILIFDTGDIKRTPLAGEFIKRQPSTRIVNIDHHPTKTDFEGQSAVDVNIVDTAAAATGEMLAEIFDELGVTIDGAMATSLLTGILTDTGHFAHHNTTPETISVAARLMAKGADHRTITKATMQNKSIGTLKLWGRALSRLAYNPQSGVVSTVVTLKDYEQCEVTDEAAEGIANFLNSLSEGKVALVLKEDVGGYVKGSFRTTSDINVAELAKKFGGGGHPKAAGFRLKGKLVQTGLGWHVERVTEQRLAPEAPVEV